MLRIFGEFQNRALSVKMGHNDHSQLFDQLFNEIINENVEKVREILMQGINPNCANHFVDTPLNRAIFTGNINIILLLIAHGANVNSCKWGSPLREAIIYNNYDVVHLLLEFGAIMQYDIMHFATSNPCDNVIKILLKKGAYANVYDNFKRTPLYRYLMRKRRSEVSFEIVKLFIECGAHVNTVDIKNNTPLKRAVVISDIRIFNILIQNGANINDGALLEAVKYEKFDIVQLLLDCGADINLEVDDKHRALDTAIMQDNVEMIRLLLENHAEVNYTTVKLSMKCTPLHLAAYISNKTVFKLLLENGAKINTTACEPTILHFAVINPNSSILNYIIESDFNMHLNSLDYPTPVCFAASTYNRKNLKYLLNRGFSFNCWDRFILREHVFDRNDRIPRINNIVKKHLIKISYFNDFEDGILREFNRDMYSEFEEQCKIEIENMKKEIVSSYGCITLFNFINKDSYSNSFLRKTGISKTLNENILVYYKKYPIYYKLLVNKIFNFTKQVILYGNCYEMLHNIFNSNFEMQHMCVSKILGYFNKKEMMILQGKRFNKNY